ncbi:MAG: FMN-binding protein [Cyclobacteriaceae bacterium]
MSKFKLLPAICFLFLVACNTSQPSENNELQKEAKTVAVDLDQPNTQQEDYSNSERLIGQMIDPNYSAGADFSQLFDSFIFSSTGEVEKASDSTTIDLYRQILDSPADDFDKVPLFEVKDAEKVVILVIGKETFANILIDKQNRSILNIQFLPGSETSDLGTKEEQFRKQFIGSEVSFSENNFGLKPWDKEKGSGDIQIDGVSGATNICQATVDMLNDQLQLYQNYFER